MDSLIIGLLVVASSLWVVIDASMLGVRKGLIKGMGDMSLAGWFFGCLGLWIVAFPLYLAKRSELKIAIQYAKKKADRSTPLSDQHLSDQRKCPFCAELIKKEAIVCRFCGRDLPVNPAAQALRNMSKPVLFSCPHCRQNLESDTDGVGQLIDCPNCQQAIEIPTR